MSPLPELRGRDLTGRPRTLPDDLGDGPAVLLIGFAIEHQREIDLWLEALDGTGVPLLEVPVAGRGDERFSRTIEGGMLPGVPAPRRPDTVVVYADRAALVAALGLPGRVPAAVRVEGGAVSLVVPGAPGPDTAAAVRARLDGPRG